MSELSFVPLGVGDAFSARWYSSCLLVEASGERILVDCPHPIRKLLCEATSGSVDVGDVSAVVLTHLHADHASGLEGFGYFSRFVLGRRARLVLHPSVRARLWEGHLAAGMEALLDADAESPRAMGLDDYFELQSLDFERPLALGSFRIECRATRHHVPTTALRITAAGRSLGISADTSFDPELIAWLGCADLIVHETNHGVHTPYAELARLPPELRAKMRLIHYPDDFDRAASVIVPLEQGVRVSV
ncbi:MAG: ribonuclease Z [Myxococcales bacterium]|nr:ribonuclease Z [Myxococcales bacterium]